MKLPCMPRRCRTAPPSNCPGSAARSFSRVTRTRPFEVRVRVDVGLLGYAYGRSGRIAEAERLASGITDPVEQALIFAGLGDRDRVFEALERAVDIGPVRLGRLLNYPEMALVRGDPRAKALRKRVGLPE